MEDVVKCVFYREDILSRGLRVPIHWNPDEAAHIAVSGITGSGKTYASKLLLGKIVKHIPASQLFVCDGKGDRDFDFLSGAERFSRGVDVGKTFNTFFDAFLKRQGGEDPERHKIFLFFDEWGAYVDSLNDKKAQDEAKRKLSLLLRLGRSFGVHVIISQQRLDANYFQANRDNFSILICIGQPSKEVKEMLFSAFKEELAVYPPRHRGTGFMLVNGAELLPIAVPSVRDKDLLHNTIKEGVLR